MFKMGFPPVATSEDTNSNINEIHRLRKELNESKNEVLKQQNEITQLSREKVDFLGQINEQFNKLSEHADLLDEKDREILSLKKELLEEREEIKKLNETVAEFEEYCEKQRARNVAEQVKKLLDDATEELCKDLSQIKSNHLAQRPESLSACSKNISGNGLNAISNETEDQEFRGEVKRHSGNSVLVPPLPINLNSSREHPSSPSVSIEAEGTLQKKLSGNKEDGKRKEFSICRQSSQSAPNNSACSSRQNHFVSAAKSQGVLIRDNVKFPAIPKLKKFQEQKKITKP